MNLRFLRRLALSVTSAWPRGAALGAGLVLLGANAPAVAGVEILPTDGDEVLPDWHTAAYGVEQLGKPHAKPFFLGIGFHKPHPPFMIPQKYFDLHPLEAIELPPYRENDLDDLPREAVRKAIGQGTHERRTNARCERRPAMRKRAKARAPPGPTAPQRRKRAKRKNSRRRPEPPHTSAPFFIP